MKKKLVLKIGFNEGILLPEYVVETLMLSLLEATVVKETPTGWVETGTSVKIESIPESSIIPFDGKESA